MTHYHNSSIRIPENHKRAARAKPIRKVSRSQRRKMDAWAQTKIERAELIGTKCEWPGCPNDWTDAHHVLKRRHFDRVLPRFRVCLCRLFCREHHDHVEQNPAKAQEWRLSMTRADAVQRGFIADQNAA